MWLSRPKPACIEPAPAGLWPRLGLGRLSPPWPKSLLAARVSIPAARFDPVVTCGDRRDQKVARAGGAGGGTLAFIPSPQRRLTLSPPRARPSAALLHLPSTWQRARATGDGRPLLRCATSPSFPILRQERSQPLLPFFFLSTRQRCGCSPAAADDV